MKAFLLLITLAFAAQMHAEPKTTETTSVRVGGDYKVSEIEDLKKKGFRVIFDADKKAGRHDRLVLFTDYVHFGLKEGAKVRLSAEILAEKKDETEVSQVVVFLDTTSGKTPIWFLSNKVPVSDLRASDFLDMHAPSNDFIIL